MIHEVVDIRAQGSGEEARLTTYIQMHSNDIAIWKRPLILICPGGGYEFTSDREAEALAIRFLAMGCHAAVLRYSCAPAVYPAALLELAKSVAYLRSRAQEWHIDPDKIMIQGCSAGGHLAASFGVFWKEDFIMEGAGVSRELLRPNGLILCYPVITSGEYAHRQSFYHLLGGRYEELVDKMSLENQVNADTPGTFIWHTFTDTSVPVQNSLLFVDALCRNGIETEFHMYPVGGHGLSLADEQTAGPDGRGIQKECASWITLVKTWIERKA